MKSRNLGTVAALAIALISAPAFASYTITQQNGMAPTYSTTLNFDEVGGPTGVVATNVFSGIGLDVFESGAGDQAIGDNSVFEPWLPSDNTAFMNFGMFLTFGSDLTEMSFQGWDPGGTPSPFGGGAAVSIWDDGVEVASSFITPAWGGFGDSWFDITTSGGMVFDEVKFLGFGFDSRTHVDNLSWNAVPEPTSLALLTMTGVGLLVRRRRTA